MDIVTEKKLNILIQLAEADKHFATSEREMIVRIAKERNFPEEAVNSLIRSPKPIDSLGALSQDQKFDYLNSCIELIYADHKIFESTLIFVKKYGQEVVANGKFTAQVSLDKRETFIEADFTINGNAFLVCDRSLEEFDYPLKIKKRVVFKYGEEPKEISDEIIIITKDQVQL